jgi:hypothetical protein
MPKSPDRRTLRFASFDEVEREIDALVNAERQGTLQRTGTWSLGQALGHLAAWINYAYDGYPVGFKIPLVMRLVAPLFKKKFLRSAPSPGVRIPSAGKDGTFGVEPLATDEGLRRVKAAYSRLRQTNPAAPNALLGRLTHEETIALHLRHAELHLGFFRADRPQ